ncbi:MAG TPA: hypothetical protein VKM72_34170 [Thermoanaerobaculia bacterium]|nr:hypothetical protein [Thermoanaerobaculia bacterium]
MKMTGALTGTFLLLGGTLATAATASDPAQSCPLHAQHQTQGAAQHEHLAGVDHRGDEVMGFSHERTAHHFLLEPEGGTIQVEATDTADSESREQIRAHLAEVARQFAAGNFSMPQEIHDRVLPGVPEMIQRKDAITYRYEDLENGGRVMIRTSDPDALAAIHAFLEAQIGDHRTGDPLAR